MEYVCYSNRSLPWVFLIFQWGFRQKKGKKTLPPFHLSLGIVATTDFPYARMRILKFGYHHSR